MVTVQSLNPKSSAFFLRTWKSLAVGGIDISHSAFSGPRIVVTAWSLQRCATCLPSYIYIVLQIQNESVWVFSNHSKEVHPSQEKVNTWEVTKRKMFHDYATQSSTPKYWQVKSLVIFVGWSVDLHILFAGTIFAPLHQHLQVDHHSPGMVVTVHTSWHRISHSGGITKY